MDPRGPECKLEGKAVTTARQQRVALTRRSSWKVERWQQTQDAFWRHDCQAPGGLNVLGEREEEESLNSISAPWPEHLG